MANASERRPKTIAVIDIGSNSARMVIAEVGPEGKIETIERAQRAVRLGHSSFLLGRLDPPTMNAAVGILRDFRRMLDSYHVEHVRAVATSAVREASNRDAFLDRVQMATGIEVEVIEPTEESRLTVSAVRDALGDALLLGSDTTLIVEVGGGSAMLTILKNGQIAASESCNLGSIRLQEILDTWQEPAERAADLLRHQIANLVSAIRRTMPIESVHSFIAIGGDARFAAHQVGEPGPIPQVTLVDAKRFDDLVAECARLRAEELARRYGMPFADAETLVPALLAYQALLHASAAHRMLVSSVSMRDGLLLDLARSVTGRDDPALVESVIDSAEAIGEKYRYDARHARHVADLSVRLFDELRPEHRLTARERLLLRVAALLHEVGGFVSSRSHHKHSYYLISNSALFGLRRAELQIVAHVARYHRRSPPKATHTDYMMLPRTERIIVNKLAAILRVADALDRGHAQQVRDLVIERRPGELLICVKGVGDLSLERRAMPSKADLFEEIYGMKVRLEEDPSLLPASRRTGPAG